MSTQPPASEASLASDSNVEKMAVVGLGVPGIWGVAAMPLLSARGKLIPPVRAFQFLSVPAENR